MILKVDLEKVTDFTEYLKRLFLPVNTFVRRIIAAYSQVETRLLSFPMPMRCCFVPL